MMLQTLVVVATETFVGLGLAFFSGVLFSFTRSFNFASFYMAALASAFYIASVRNLFLDNLALQQNITFIELIILGLAGVALFRFINLYFFKNNPTASKVLCLSKLVFFVATVVTAFYTFGIVSIPIIFTIFGIPAVIFWLVNFVQGKDLDSFLPFTLFGLLLIVSVIIRFIPFDIAHVATNRDVFQFLFLIASFFLFKGFSSAYQSLSSQDY